MDTAVLMASKHTGRTYRIRISLPYGYIESWPFGDPLDRWPVIYLLDSNWYFGMVSEMVHSMAWCGGTSDAIVVGIGYLERENPEDTWMDVMVRRTYDFTAVRSEDHERSIAEMTKRSAQTGDAVRFHQFIREELIPVVESDYRADPSMRVLVGHSSGGDFAAFALFEAPDLFNTFVIGSCAPGRYDRLLFSREEAYAEAHHRLATKAYFSAGELEETEDDPRVSDMGRLADLLASRNYDGLTAVHQVFADTNHCEVIALGFQAGLKFALRQV